MTPVQSLSEVDSTATLLNESLRRLKQYRGEPEWVSALLDGAAPFAPGVALFAVEISQFRLRGARGVELPENLIIEKGMARAFDSVLDTKDTVVALRTAAEVSRHLASSDPSDRAALLPILNGSRAAAILVVVNNAGAPSAAIELLSGIASLVLERSANTAANVQIAPAAAAKPSRKLPYWSNLGDEQRELHLRAQRFARVKVAEMELFQPEACRAGREQNNVYLFLKKEIDGARESYRDRFLSRPGMEDYLHLELVNTVAGGDETKLGVDYPGHLG